jgi:hypothetical protein
MLVVAKVVKELHVFLRKSNAHYGVHRSSPLASIPSHMHTVHVQTPLILSVEINIHRE